MPSHRYMVDVMQTKTWIVGLLLLVPAALAQGFEGGGAVSNVLGSVTGLTNSEGSVAPRNGADLISGKAVDPNGEGDVAAITLSVARDGGAPTTFVFDTFDGIGTERPATATNGWRVWNSGGLDGVYDFEHTYTYTAVGTYVVGVSVTDAVGTGTVEELTVEVRDFVEVLAKPVDGAGVEQDGRWGGWQTAPGDTNVESNFLRVRNSGDIADMEITVAFEDGAFTGTDGTATIGITGNIEFRCAETDPNAPAAPTTAFSGVAWVEADAGSCTFSSTDALMYVQYRIQEVPIPLKAQDYETGFIVQPTV